MIDREVIDAFVTAATSPAETDLPRAALLLARIEHRTVDVARYLTRLERLGADAAARVQRLGTLATGPAQLDAINTLLFEDEGFRGNTDRYDDPRNSYLNDVLDRRTGIPVSLSVVYIDVGRRAGLNLEGVNFPGHFLVRFRAPRGADGPRELIADPFNQGAILSEIDLRQLARNHLGEDAPFDRALLGSAGKPQILSRMLQNLKHLFIGMRSFPQAHDAVALLLAIDPADVGELRDRALLSYHRHDFRSALRDLEAYFRAVATPPTDADAESRQEYEQLWEHMKAIRRLVAALN